ncbi:MAG TPA: hypothetical protein VEP69_01795 [Thermodesulfovibrionales bacterium]|nr:hypothetical protein [Thermodesulfovibrionales bacterium]
MPDSLPYRLLCLLLVLAAAVPAFGAGQAQKGATRDIDDEEEAAETAAPEPPKQVINIDVRENLLSVELENADFGSVIRAIADKAKFRLEGSSPVFGKKLNTKFSDMEIDRGVTRLFSLLKESNYLINYDSKGAISRLEILSTATGSAAGSGARPTTGVQTPVRPQQQPVRQLPAPSTVVPPRPLPVPVRPAPPSARPVGPAARPVQPQIVPDDEDDDEDVEEIPLNAPPSTPHFSPRRK